MKYSYLLILIFSACSAAPTIQQRQDNWNKYRTSVEVTCKVGRYDPAMPTDVRAWCSEVTSQ